MDGGVVGLVLDLAFPTVVIAMLILAYARRHRRGGTVRDEPAGMPYRVDTRQFDLDLDARDVPVRLRAIPLLRSRGWVLTDPGIWHRKVAAARAVVVDASGALAQKLREAVAATTPADWAICFLVDHSGSMKDEPIRESAAALRWCSKVLTDLGVKVAVLGFSTVGWHGGQAGIEWVADGRPKRPGRLAALLHITYQAFGEQLDDEAWSVMLHPDVLRENIDGEAIVWAGSLLDDRTEAHRALIILSDGAPVDDATLLHNGPNYLWRHLKKVIAEREAMLGMLAAIGMNYRVDTLYARSRSVTDSIGLTAALVDLITDVLADPSSLHSAS